MKNILLLTNIYPNNDPNYDGTRVCHFFTQEWVKMGYNVQVVHFDSLFPRPYYWIGKLFKSKIQAKTGTVAYTDTPRKSVSYVVDGVPVLFVPMFKLIPHKAPSQKRMQKAFDIMLRHLNSQGFVPDVITSHFTLPQLQMLHYCKKQWSGIRTCLVLHNAGEGLSAYPNYMDLMPSVDVWGFRSKAFLEKFEQRFGKHKDFICYSGIPERYIEPVEKTFEGGVRKFAFVGSLYELKRVEDTLRALKLAFPNGGYSFTIAGSGDEMDRLKTLCSELGIQDNVKFLGQVKRDEAQEVMREADCFVMVSSHEAFGLVYVEAMAKGCITIATRGQGGDGIITDGVDGFLCESKQPEKLAGLLKNIAAMSPDDLKKMSQKAIERSKELSNGKVAESYLKNIQEL